MRSMACVHQFGGHRALVQRPAKALAQLVAAEFLALAGLLHHRRGTDLGGFKGGEALVAGVALAPAADADAVLGQAGFHHLGVGGAAEGALHG
jgi:hypothetical protein